MLIISDDHSSTINLLGSEFGEEISELILSSGLEKLKQYLFQTNKIGYYKSNFLKDWDYVAINEFAIESQFDTINLLLAKNVELPNKIVCLAEEGKGFHGFRNRNWKTLKGNIHLTIHFQPTFTSCNIHSGLLIVAAVSVLETIDSVPGLKDRSLTKWVNDITIDKSKVCGIITQSYSIGNEVTGAVIGIGLNVKKAPKIKGDHFTNMATAIMNYASEEHCKLPSVLKNLLGNLSKNTELLNSGGYNHLWKIYCDRSDVIGKNVEIFSDKIEGESKLVHSGKVIDINKNLELIFENNPSPINSGRLSILD